MRVRYRGQDDWCVGATDDDHTIVLVRFRETLEKTITTCETVDIL